MKSLISILFFIGIIGLSKEHPKRRGICLTFCGAYSHYSCPTGYECRSNGCGHECYRPADFQIPEGCQPLSCDGQSHCPLGYETDVNGCDTCKCDYSAFNSNLG